jgi:hypothetical protein
MVRFLPLAAVVLVLAACGGGSEPSSTQDWANGVCTAVSNFQSSATDAIQSVQGGNLSENTLKQAASQLKDATNTFQSDLKKLGPPNTDAGQQAQATVNDLADKLSKSADSIQSSVTNSSSVLGAVSSITGTLATAQTEVSAAVNKLTRLDAQGELQQAFDKADACKKLKND